MTNYEASSPKHYDSFSEVLEMEKFQTIIIGGGPAGSAAAITLARGGHETLLIDKADFPRDKCCGDGLTALALRLGENLGLVPSQIACWKVVNQAVLHTRNKNYRERCFPLPEGTGQYAAVVPRKEYDKALLDLARDAGAEIRQGHAITRFSQSVSGIEIEVNGIKTFQSASAIAADGMWSPTRRLLGLSNSSYRGEWHAFRQYDSNTGPAAENLHIWFEPDLLPGYVWSFPLPNHRANVGFGVIREGEIPIGRTGQIWNDLFHRAEIQKVLGPDAKFEGRRSAWPIPARIDKAILNHGSVLFAGDAAAATDTLTGEGIGQALLTGTLAAKAIIRGGDPAEIGAQYRRSTYAELLADHRMSRTLQKVMEKPLGVRSAITIVNANKWTRRHFARWMFEDYPRALLTTPRRWRRGGVKRHGAYF